MRPPSGADRPFQAATIAHAAALAAIHAASFPPAERWTAEAMAQQLAQPGGFGRIDPAGAMILARMAADEAEILTLAVAPPLRRQGRARALLAAAMAEAKARMASCLFLEVAITNGAAHSLYTQAGFQQIGRRRRYYPDGSDALVLRCALAPV